MILRLFRLRMREFARWTPKIPTLLYHGTKEERVALRSQLFGTSAC